VRLLPLPGVFQPRSDSHMLAQCVREERLAPDARVLDLCTGSGLVAVTAGLAHGAQTTAVDISRRAVWAARLNGLLNGVRVRAVRGDLFAPLGDERFDLIASNPPYLPGPIERLPRTGPERHWEGGVHGRVFIDRICDEAPAHLRPGGSLLLLQSSVCDIPATLARLGERQLDAEIVFTHRGPLGPILSSRADWLRRQGLLGNEDTEEVVIIRGRLPDQVALPQASSARRTAENGRTDRPGAMRAGTRSD
jgi:release factor glutamine methyltransferase